MEDINLLKKIVKCGKCGKFISPIKLKIPVAISEWDKSPDRSEWDRTYNVKRDISFNCCGRTWLMDYNEKPLDCGIALEGN